MDAQAHVGEEGEEPLPPLEVLSSSRAVHEKVVVANGIEEVEDLVSNCWGGWLVGGGQCADVSCAPPPPPPSAWL